MTSTERNRLMVRKQKLGFRVVLKNSMGALRCRMCLASGRINLMDEEKKEQLEKSFTPN